MRKIIQLIVLIAFVTVFVHSVQAQVKLQLSLMADKKTYVVSMIPEATLSYPMNITGTAQITLRYSSGSQFTVSNLKNILPNVLWHDNAYLESPQSGRGYSFVSFGLRSQGTTAIPYEIGREVALFSFQNYYGCTGKIELLDNNVQNLSAEEALTYNIGNHWTTMANQTEAYTGNVLSSVNCSVVSSTEDDKTDKLFSSLTAYPVPASDRLTLKINAKTADVQKLNQIQFLNAIGQVVLTQKVKVQSGEQELTVDVSSLTTGLYLFQLQGEGVSSKNYKFIVSEN